MLREEFPTLVQKTQYFEDIGRGTKQPIFKSELMIQYHNHNGGDCLNQLRGYRVLQFGGLNQSNRVH